MSPEFIGLLMIGGMLLGIFVGFPISFTLIFLGLVFGYWGFGELVFYLMTLQFNASMMEQTLESAVSAGVQIIPVWHGGFTFRPGVYALPAEVEEVLVTTHTIRVLEESAVGYNNAIVELLNRFGATPG